MHLFILTLLIYRLYNGSFFCQTRCFVSLLDCSLKTISKIYYYHLEFLKFLIFWVFNGKKPFWYINLKAQNFKNRHLSKNLYLWNILCVGVGRHYGDHLPWCEEGQRFGCLAQGLLHQVQILDQPARTSGGRDRRSYVDAFLLPIHPVSWILIMSWYSSNIVNNVSNVCVCHLVLVVKA